MAKKHDPDLVAMARRGYEKWLREMRSRSEPALIERYAAEVTKDDSQTFFGFDTRRLIAALSE
jgi:hypothetical protein